MPVVPSTANGQCTKDIADHEGATEHHPGMPRHLWSRIERLLRVLDKPFRALDEVIRSLFNVVDNSEQVGLSVLNGDLHLVFKLCQLLAHASPHRRDVSEIGCD